MTPRLAGPPPPGVAVPAAVRAALDARGFRDAVLRPAWRNEAGGLTFSVASGGAGHAVDLYAKWNPVASGESLGDEAERLRWIAGRHPAPAVVDLMTDAGEEVLLTRALPGESAVSERWARDPDAALRALGTGLRRLHDVPLDGCPFDGGVAHRLRAAHVPAGTVEPAPPIDRLVLCQGDPCAPNTLLAGDGSFLAHVDLARLGAADRWADLAVMTMSLEWNYRGYDEAVFWEAYGAEPDPIRIAYYRRLWDAT
ncbi:aminoglycoside 3'-phosphotransferase [Microbacterium sp. No. 7]|uniref:aminoglycoside 3'-phosphotransferase n=1 Tax=Microbacterium sp. No. 7 TaxID=1714373 RepID=UPI0006ED2094|nr:aminoglycoside 3'-phosphotransferase [Microbacterium sp. No. 7]ALJ21737.1 hypothetical protein AOA12_18300 [Microbacterium sp. No. 7]